MKKRRSIITIFGGMALVMICVYMVISVFVVETQVKGDSMFPTLSERDVILIDRISYHIHEPKRFDIIVFPYKYKEETYYIKRIVGMPGETVKIDDNEIYINGEKINDIYGREKMKDAGLASYEIKLSSDEYFVLGDNRNISRDSRDPDVGNVKKADIVGRAFMRILPLNNIELLN